MNRLLENQTALICGVGPSLGTDVARLFAAEGAKVALMSRSDSLIEGLAEELRRSGAVARAFTGDMTVPEDCSRVVRLTEEALGPIDVLVTVAFRDDSPNRKSLVDSAPDLSDWRRVFEINLFGTMLAVKAALPRMIERRTGRVVLVNSMTSERVLAKAASYSGSKAALKRAAQCVALEVAPYNVRVNSVHPGYMWNNFVVENYRLRAEQNGTTLDREKAGIAANIPLGYVPTTDEYAKSVLYLASDLSGPMTGASLHVNGGQYIG